MNNEEMIQKAASAMVPILEQESNMIWGERSCANILRWTLAKAGFRLTPLQADAARHEQAEMFESPAAQLKHGS